MPINPFVRMMNDFDEKTKDLLQGVQPKDIIDGYRRHIRSEVDELDAAFKEEDVVETIDALCDIAYLAIGCATRVGFDFEKHFEAVHNANMAKEIVQTPKGLRLIKPEGWPDPDERHKEIILAKRAADAKKKEGPKKSGRERVYANNAEKQKAYRERIKAKKAEEQDRYQDDAEHFASFGNRG